MIYDLGKKVRIEKLKINYLLIKGDPTSTMVHRMFEIDLLKSRKKIVNFHYFVHIFFGRVL